MASTFMVDVFGLVESYSEVLLCMPSIQRTASFLYLLSPRELILMAGSFPRLPQRLRVRGETRRTSATSRTVRRSGRFSREIGVLVILMSFERT